MCSIWFLRRADREQLRRPRRAMPRTAKVSQPWTLVAAEEALVERGRRRERSSSATRTRKSARAPRERAARAGGSAASATMGSLGIDGHARPTGFRCRSAGSFRSVLLVQGRMLDRHVDVPAVLPARGSYDRRRGRRHPPCRGTRRADARDPSSEGRAGRPATLARATAVPLALEIAAARAAGGLSRLARTGGGTTLPGKLLWKLDPGAIDRLARTAAAGLGARLRDERQDDDGRDGGRDPRRARRGSRTTPRARTSSPGVASALLASRGRRARAVRGRRGRPARGRARACGRARSASATSSATSSTATASSRPSPRAGGGRSQRPPGRRCSSSTATTRRSATSRAGARDASRSGSTTRGTRGPSSSTRPTRSGASAAGRAYEYAAAYVGHLGDYRCPNCGHARPPLDVVARDDRARRARVGVLRRSSRRRGARRVSLRAARALQRLQRARRRLARARARARRSTRSPPGSSASTPRSAASSGSTSATGGCSMLLIKNPAGANEAVRTLVAGGAAAARRRRAQRRDRRRPGRLLDLGRRLRAAARAARAPRRDRRRAPPSSRCASSTAASTRARSRSSRRSSARSTAASS